jgi:hypothetical protein
MSTYSKNGKDWYEASREQIEFMEQAQDYFKTSNFIYDNGKVRIIPLYIKDSYVILYPDKTFSYLQYKSLSKQFTLDQIKSRLFQSPLSPINESFQEQSEVQPEVQSEESNCDTQLQEQESNETNEVQEQEPKIHVSFETNE